MGDPVTNAAISVATTVGKEAVNSVSKGIGQTFSDMWYTVYGYKWSEQRQKKEIEVAYNVEKFKEEIQSKADKIPDENRIEPDIDIIGSTLESARFRINKKEIRDMFSNLMVSAMDSSKADDIHPSFSEMIKMLSPLDAKNLFYLYRDGDETISKIRTIMANGNYTDHISHIFFGNPECQDHWLIEPSIDNLIRLKLVDVSYDYQQSNDSLYDKHRNNPLLSSFKDKREKNYQANEAMLENIKNGGVLMYEETNVPVLLQEEIIKNIEKYLAEFKSTKVKIKKGVIRLTAFGKNFCKVCL